MTMKHADCIVCAAAAVPHEAVPFDHQFTGVPCDLDAIDEDDVRAITVGHRIVGIVREWRGGTMDYPELAAALSPVLKDLYLSLNESSELVTDNHGEQEK